jgi:putative ABC transport system ATP-binding protein
MGEITLNHVSYSYKTKYQTVHAVTDATGTFESGRVYAIVGESGSGKSTLLSLLAGLDLPGGGDILVDGINMRDKDRDAYRRGEASVVYQAFHLLPLLTVTENVTLPMELTGVSKSERAARAGALLQKVGLAEDTHGKFPKMMSGGQQQRVAIARSLASDSKILLADEPTGNLDTENGQNVVNILLELAHDEGYLVVIVTHNPDVAAQADVVYRMRDGVLSREGGESVL